MNTVFRYAIIIVFVSNLYKIYQNTFSSNQLKLLKKEFEGNIKISKTNYIVFGVLVLFLGLPFPVSLHLGWIIILVPVLFLRYVFVVPRFLFQNSIPTRFQSFYMIYSNNYQSYKSIAMVLVHITIMMTLYLLFFTGPSVIGAYVVVTTSGVFATTGMMLVICEWFSTIMGLVFVIIYTKLSLVLYCDSRGKDNILLN
ncbi:MAG: hypothetical protein P8P83_03585 [Rickettsiaceae bacterium]|nr:hypothetical protein [Rickettsiaceae bacterium]